MLFVGLVWNNTGTYKYHILEHWVTVGSWDKAHWFACGFQVVPGKDTINIL